MTWAKFFGFASKIPHTTGAESFSPSAVSEALLNNQDEATVVVYAYDAKIPATDIAGLTASDSLDALSGKVGAIETTRPGGSTPLA